MAVGLWPGHLSSYKETKERTTLRSFEFNPTKKAENKTHIIEHNTTIINLNHPLSITICTNNGIKLDNNTTIAIGIITFCRYPLTEKTNKALNI